MLHAERQRPMAGGVRREDGRDSQFVQGFREKERSRGAVGFARRRFDARNHEAGDDADTRIWMPVNGLTGGLEIAGRGGDQIHGGISGQTAAADVMLNDLNEPFEHAHHSHVVNTKPRSGE